MKKKNKIHDCVKKTYVKDILMHEETNANSGCHQTPQEARTQKQEYFKMMNPPEIINMNYTPDQEGQEIRQEDVVRPMNHKITTKKEHNWKEISRSPAPTYGSCNCCFRSGPLGKRCNRYNNGEYQAILLMVKGGAIETLDSITMSEIMG